MNPAEVPDTLLALFLAHDDTTRELAWRAFLQGHSNLIVHVSRNNGGDHDIVMDRYLFVIEALRENDFRRLRGYSSDAGVKFTTWLLVVTRRLCFDHHRTRYGRTQSDSDASAVRHSERQQLVDLVGSEVGIETLEMPPGQDPEALLRRKELREALDRALNELPTSDRLLLRFRFEDNLSVPEIARLIAADSPFATYRRLDKVLCRLREILQAFGVSEPLP